MTNCKWGWLVSTVVLSCFLLLTRPCAAQSTEYWLTQIHPLEDAVLVVGPQDTYAPLVRAIKQAQTSIQMSIYHLTDQSLIQALIQAQARNVVVYVIIDSASLKSPHYQGVFQQLKVARVHVIASSSGFHLTHSKLFLIDGSLAYVSSMNFVGHSSEMRGYGVFTRDTSVVAEIHSVFAADLANAKNNTAVTPQLSNPNLLWAPVNSEQKLVDLIHSAKTTIEATTENLGPGTDVLTALAEASQRGVSVRIISPQCDLNPNPLFNLPQMTLLAGAGVQARLMPAPSTSEVPYMHAKTMIVDKQTVFIGSENLSYSSLRLSREAGLVLSNSKVTAQMETVFEKDWNAAVVLPATPPVCPSLQLTEPTLK